MEDDTIRDAAAIALGDAPQRVVRLHGGANNVVARIEIGGRVRVAKLYFSHPGDPRDRLGTEFGMLSFLWDRGLRCVPEPVTMSREASVGIYGFVAGAGVVPPVTWQEAVELLEFLAAMREASADPAADELPVASDASATVRGRLDELGRRLARLEAGNTPRWDGAVHAFVERELRPGVAAVSRWVERAAGRFDLELDAEIGGDEWILSPGDVGFHNVIKDESGHLCFIDFEYAGWDDVAQVLAQACLAPDVPVPTDLHVMLLRELLAKLAAEAAVLRLRVLYPVLAAKWSLIVLNELVDIGGKRRAFAGVDVHQRQEAQIRKSRRLLGFARTAAAHGSPLDALLPRALRQKLASLE